MTKPLPKKLFLLINHTQQSIPDQPGKSKVIEQCLVTSNLTDSKMRKATVIVDILNKKLIKSRYSSENSSKVMQHYLEEYLPEIKKYFLVYHGMVYPFEYQKEK